MAKRYHQMIAFILTVIFVTACTSTPPTASSQTAALETLIVTVSTPTDPPPTVTPTTMPPRSTTLPPTPTALSATATNPPPTTVPPTEEVESDDDHDNPNVMEANRMNIEIGDIVLTATLVDNSSAAALKQALLEGPITVDMRDYGSMEKVGSLGLDLPRNDQQITTEAGDIILFQGSALVIYYAPNSWNFTRLGKINNVSAEELREVLGDGNVTIMLSLPQD